jgi:hypothetical protein
MNIAAQHPELAQELLEMLKTWQIEVNEKVEKRT